MGWVILCFFWFSSKKILFILPRNLNISLIHRNSYLTLKTAQTQHFLLCINSLPDVICNFAVYADNTTLYSKCDQASDLWQHIELVFDLESDLWDTVDWGRKRLLDFNAGKTQLVLFDRSNTLVLLMWKWMGLFWRKNHVLRCCGWLSLQN